jgi:serine/threonine protein kinase
MSIWVRNKYQIIEELGKGQFGIVYKAKTHDGCLVAIKYDITNISILKHEVTMLNYLCQRKCNSKNISKIIWYGKSEIPYESSTNLYSCLVLPYYDYSLKQLMNTTNPKDILSLPLKSWMSQMLHIIQSIHQLYVIHRDLKPDNFMIKDSQIYLIDFGMSTFFIHGETGKHVPNNQEPKTEIVGSPMYASIHVHEGNKSSRRDDCIQLGYIFLYMILGGHLPWEGIQCMDNSYPASHIMYPANQERCILKKKLNSLIDAETSDIYKYIMDCYELEYESKPSYFLHSI